MSNITLREYYREVETLVAQGRLDEVVAHCRHILKFYPKDVSTYRLLGKSYLESRRLSDATDILQRVLSVIPDDFVSHVGMSLIREDEANLDAAIWHMERAFEVQPSNAAIRDEVRRLFGKRDGLEPPKIRLTRGALARMYANGNLYQQSISELRSALAEEPQRFDLLVLLARMYFLNGMHVDAAEVCNTLLNKLPFCLDANRILAAVLHHSDRGSEAAVYMERLQVLDPYSPHAPPGALDSDAASDTAITLPRLTWEPGQEIPATDSHPSWASSLGIDLGDSQTGDESLPDWLQEDSSDSGAEFLAEFDLPQEPEDEFVSFASDEGDMGNPPQADPQAMEEAPESTSEGTDSGEDLIPEWMKDSGWATAGTEEEDAPSPLPGESGFLASAEGGPAETGEVPEWLRDMAPGPLDSSEEIDLSEEEMSGEIPAWLSSQPPGHTDSVVMWLQDQPDMAELPKTGPLPSIDPESGEDVPDWLNSVVASMAATGAAEAVERRRDEPEAEPEVVPEPEPGFETPAGYEVESSAADWLEAEEAAAPPDPLEDTRPRGTGALVPPESDAPPAAVFEGSDEDELTEVVGYKPEETSGIDWSFEEPEAVVESETSDIQGQEDDLPEWLTGTGSGEHEVSFEQMADEPGGEEEIPEWLSDLEKEAEGFSQEPEASFGREEMVPDRAALESNPEIPPWMAAAGLAVGASVLGADEPEETPAGEEMLEMGSETDLGPEDPSGFDQAPVVEEWGLGEDVTPSDADQDAALAWLEGLARKQGVDEEELVTAPETREETPPEWVVDSLQSFEDEETPPPAASEDEGAVADQSAEWAIETLEKETGLEEEPPWAIDTVASLPKAEEIPDWATETVHAPVGDEDLPDWSTESMHDFSDDSEDRLPSWAEDTLTAEAEGADLEEADAQAAEVSSKDSEWMRDTLIPQVDEEVDAEPTWAPEEVMDEGQAQPRGEDVGYEWMMETALPEQEVIPADDGEAASAEEPSLPEAERESQAEAEWMLETSTPEALEEDQGEEQPGWMAAATAATAGAAMDLASREDEETSEVAEEEWMVETAIPGPELSASSEMEPEPEPFVELDVPMAESGDVSEVAAEPEGAAGTLDAAEGDGVSEIVERDTSDDPHEAMLEQAKHSLSDGDIQDALASYNKLIRGKKHLATVIQDLEEALYRYPVDTNILESLGDAYAGSNRLQDAVNAYTKAEELLH